MINTIVVLDCETSDLPSEPGAALLELAWVALSRTASGWRPAAADSTLVEYDGPIAPQARAAHHLVPEDLKPGRPGTCPREAVIHSLLAAEEPGAMYYAYHNAEFDRQFLPELTLPSLCTLRLARHLYPDAPAYGAQVLRYHLNCEPDPGVIAGLAPHRALYDAAVTAALLAHMLASHEPEELLTLQDKPVLQKICGFGKHRGQAWADVPRDYLAWLNKKSDMVAGDRDLQHTVRYHLGLV